jgi:hypothetical protein
MQPVMQVRFIYGLNEDRKGSGNGLADLAAWVRVIFPNVEVVINEYGDNVAQQLRESAQRGIRLFLLVGHSFGGAAIIKAARAVESEMVIQDAVLIDAVTNLLWGQGKGSEWIVPDNVLVATAFYQRQSVFPILSSKIRNLGPGRFNTEVSGLPSYEHCTICKDANVQQNIRDRVMKMHQRSLES